MSDQLLNTLKVALLALLYLFFARVLWAVWSEVRVPVATGLSPKANAAGSGSGSRSRSGSGSGSGFRV
jgi:hypothetical protein